MRTLLCNHLSNMEPLRRRKKIYDANTFSKLIIKKRSLWLFTGKILYYNILFAQQPYFTFLLRTRLRIRKKIVGTVADEVISVKNWTFTIYVRFDVLIIIYYTI